MTISLINGNALHIPLADKSVNCVVTSPPYWALRDYGVPGQLGLEKSPGEYVAHMVDVFSEVWRVLRDDGTVFLNLGDSYYSNPGNGRGGGSTLAGGKPHLSGAPRVKPCGTSDREQSNYQDRGCLCGNLCDVCRVVYQNRTSHSVDLLAAMLTASLSGSNRERMESLTGHLPTSDLERRADHNAVAIQDQVSEPGHVGGRLRAALVSMLGESYPQLLDECLRRANRGVCLLCARSLGDCVQECADNLISPCVHCSTSASTRDHSKSRHGKVLTADASADHIEDKAYDCSYQDYTTTPHHLKPKDLVGIPWRVAFALQDAGYYLRSDIIWSKPNPMPESVTDRPTKAHEYLFLLAKSERYYYDNEAVKEPVAESTVGRGLVDFGGAKGREYKANIKPDDPNYRNGSEQWGRTFDYRESCATGRNRRTVWTIATEPTSEAHFATYPRALVEPCIKAGCPAGGIVLDPFAGSGTTGIVARQLGRHFVGLDLSFTYLSTIARKRLELDALEAWTEGIQAGSDGYHDLPLFIGEAS